MIRKISIIAVPYISNIYIYIYAASFNKSLYASYYLLYYKRINFARVFFWKSKKNGEQHLMSFTVILKYRREMARRLRENPRAV